MPDTGQDKVLEEVVEGLRFPDSPDYDRAVEILGRMPPGEVRELFGRLMDDPDAPLALGVTRAVGILKLHEATDLMMALVEEPGKWFGHADRALIRMAAVESLGLLRASESVEILLGLISASHDAEIQLGAVRALGRIGDQSSVHPLIARMRAQPAIALSATGALAQIGGEDAFQGLLKGLESDEEMIRSASVWALGKMADERAIRPLMRLVMRSDAFLRRDIAWALGQIGGMLARVALGTLCQRDPDPGVRREAARAIQGGAVLGRSGGEASTEE